MFLFVIIWRETFAIPFLYPISYINCKISTFRQIKTHQIPRFFDAKLTQLLVSRVNVFFFPHLFLTSLPFWTDVCVGDKTIAGSQRNIELHIRDYLIIISAFALIIVSAIWWILDCDVIKRDRVTLLHWKLFRFGGDFEPMS